MAGAALAFSTKAWGTELAVAGADSPSTVQVAAASTMMSRRSQLRRDA
jgi:hypothetical protein